MPSSTAARLAVFLAAVQQILAPVFIFPRGFGGFAASQSVPTPIEPAAYAFGIWGIIYTGCLVYAVLQLLPRYANHHAFVTIRWPTVGLFAGSTLWLLFARFGPNWLTVPVIMVMLGCALYAMLTLARWKTPLPGHVKVLVGWPLAIYAGWISVASFVNAASVLPYWRTGTAGLGTEGLAVLMLAMAGVAAAAVLWRSRGALAYALAIIWGIAAVAVANSGIERTRVFDNGTPDVPAVFWTALVAVSATIVVLALARVRRPTHHGHHHAHPQFGRTR